MTDSPERIAGKTIAEWAEFARRDDCLDRMVPSDLRQLIGAIAAEREACAKVAEDFYWSLPAFESSEINEETDDAAWAVSEQIATAIRARKDTE